MKLIGIVVTLIVCVAGSFAQGTINFNNNIPGVTVSHVYYGYGPAKVGNGLTDYPPSGNDWSGYFPLEASWWSAQLWAAPGRDVNPLSLKPAFPITTFRTGAEAGFVNPVTATLTGVPADAPVATVQLRVWHNDDGRFPTWDVAVAAGQLHAMSLEFPVFNIGGNINPPPSLFPLQSFSIQIIPEPTSAALLCLGGCVLWLQFQRRGRPT